MASGDNLERTLREIHVLFSKSESVEGEPDKVIVDRKKLLDLLDDLNRAVFAVMDAYEDTKESRTRGELASRQKGKQIIEDASRRADDVYAASVLYTADAIGEVQILMDQINDSMNEMFHSFRVSLREQKDRLRRNELELESELQDLEDTRLYQNMLEDIRMEQRRRQDAEYAQRKEQTANRRRTERIYTPPSAADVKVNETYFEKQGISAEDAKTGYVPSPQPLTAERPEVIVNYNSEYFKRKAALEKENQTEDSDGPADEQQEEPAQIPAYARNEIPADQTDDGPTGGPGQTQEEKNGLQAAAGQYESPDEDENRPVPGWKERMKTLLNEIAPKDLDDH